MTSIARHEISITHNFETAHRLHHPNAPTKCQSIHGHSWWVTATLVGSQLDEQGMLLEFGAFKKKWRGWLDDEVDHHLALHQDDPVGSAILGVLPNSRVLYLPFEPTTENLSQWIFTKTREILVELGVSDTVSVAQIHLQETRVNAARFSLSS